MEDTRTTISGFQRQEQLTGALIGIARAVDGNEHLISDSTDQIIQEGLTATIPGAEPEEERLLALIQGAEDEKRKLVPLCYECASPCGKNNNYDIRRLRTAEEDVCSLKLLILCGIRSMAACARRSAGLGRTDHEVDRFFYQALFAVGEESFGVQELLSVVRKFGEMEPRCIALLDNNNGGTEHGIHQEH